MFRDFWLLREYLPAAAETDKALAIPIEWLTSLLPSPTSIRPIPIPHDCTDGFGGAYWRRPERYLNETVRAGMSMLALTPEPRLREGLVRLRADLDSGAWASDYATILGQQTLDLGYRLLIADLPVDWMGAS